jgi:hypothetical protein
MCMYCCYSPCFFNGLCFAEDTTFFYYYYVANFVIEVNMPDVPLCVVAICLALPIVSILSLVSHNGNVEGRDLSKYFCAW